MGSPRILYLFILLSWSNAAAAESSPWAGDLIVEVVRYNSASLLRCINMRLPIKVELRMFKIVAGVIVVALIAYVVGKDLPDSQVASARSGRYQLTCGSTTTFNNTYFYNNGFPGTYPGGPGRCTLTVKPNNENICQLRIDFLAFTLAPPNGNGECLTDFISILGGSTRVPRICGENTGQHVYVDFNGNASILITVETTPSYVFNRQWQLQVSQIGCDSPYRAPSGCLQYHFPDSGMVMSFNYGYAANALPNSIGVEGTRQLSNQHYRICVRKGANKCGITWSQMSSDVYSFTVTGDVEAIDPTFLGTQDLQETMCTTDFVVIPNPMQGGASVASDRFCGLGLVQTTSFTKPFALFVVTDDNENFDIANRGFALSYSQNACPVSTNE